MPARSAADERTVNIRSGTASSPGPILASGSASVETSLGYVSVDLTSTLATTVGTKLVIEVPNALAVEWQGTCGAISGNCLALNPDLYPAGVSNSALIGGFAFRTYAAAAATATASPTDTSTGHAGDSGRDGLDGARVALAAAHGTSGTASPARA